MIKWIITLITLCAGGYYYLYAEPEPVEKTVIKTHKIAKSDLRLSVAATGVVKPYVEVEVKSKAGGEIIDFAFEEGANLKKNQVVVKLDPDTEQSRVNKANADLLMAEAKLEKTRINQKDADRRLKRKSDLYVDGVISRQELDDALIVTQRAQSDVKIAKAELIRARESLKETKDRLSETRILAPLDGSILKKHVEKGQVIASTLSSASEGTPLFTMADLTRLYVSAMVDETDIGRVKSGQKSSITVDAYPEKMFEGAVLRIAPKGRVESAVTIFDVIIEVLDRDRDILRPMMSANVEILYDIKKNRLLAPSELVKLKGASSGVNKVVNEKIIWTPVTIGASDGIKTEISGAIKEGDRIALSDIEDQKKRKKGLGGKMWFFRKKK